MLARWLLPVVAALAILGQSLTTWAASGSFGEAACCCPAPKECKCHDHGGPKPAQMRRCTGDAKHVAPVPLVATPPAPIALACELVVARVALAPPLARPARRSEPPEKPPF